jgi:hypothetical protein
MCVANDLEQLPRLPPAIVQVKLAMLLPFQGVLMEAAREALEQAVERMEKLGVNSSFL